MKMYKRLATVAIIAQFVIMFIILNFFKVDDMTLATGEVTNLDSGWTLMYPDGHAEQLETLPYASESKAGDVLVLSTRLPRKFCGKTLFFLSADKELIVRMDGEDIYSFGKNNVRLFGHTPGSVTNFVDIPMNCDGYLEIEMVSPYDNYASSIGKIRIADRDVAILKVLKENTGNLLCSFVMLFCGLILILLPIVQPTAGKERGGMFSLGGLLIWGATYYAIETKILSIWYGNQTLYSFMIFSFLMCMPLLLVFHYARQTSEENHRIYRVVLPVVLVNIVTQLVLQLCNVRDFMDMVVFSHAIIFITTIILIWELGRQYYQKREGIILMEMMALMFLIGGSLVDIVRNYVVRVGDFGKYSRYGTVLYCLCTVYVAFYRMLEDTKAEEREQNAQMRRQNEELKIARQNAETANRAKSEFLSQMSHEIRTPINAVIGMNEMILREEKDDQLLEYASAVQNSANALLGIINDILDISKIEAGKMEIVENKYSLSSLLVDSYNMIADRAENKGLEFSVSCDETLPAVLFGDMVRVRQILINLLTNAVKYTERGRVELSVSGDRRGSRLCLCVQVKDTGIGMKPENVEALFDKFSRFDLQRNRSIEGTGLGLSITKELVELMHGEIRVESEYGKGSVFTVNLPQGIEDETPIGVFDIEKQRHIRNQKRYQRSFTAETAEVLVVDDVEINLKVFCNLLKETKVRVDTALSGAECLERVKDKSYDIIFMDHMMPEMDGIETLDRMKRMEENKSLNAPVIMLTANALTGMKEQYLADGFTDYLSKPIEGRRLEKMLSKYLPQEKVIYEVQESEEKDEVQTVDKTIEEQPVGQQDRPQMVPGGGVEALKACIPDLDTESALMFCGESMDFYLELLKDYADRDRITLLSELYEKADWENYAIEVHALKGTSRTMGLMELGDIAEGLQDAARAKDEEYIRAHHSQMIEQLEFVMDCIDKM